MGRRALIIAVEDYPSVTDGSIAKKLPGTLAAGVAFRDWLIAKWDSELVAADDRQIELCSEPTVPGGRQARHEDILKALVAIKAAGQNATEEFFFFFSGHGFSFVAPGARADMLICSNYESMEYGSVACLNLDEAVYWLRQELGPGSQYYFVDACRNELDGTRIARAPLGLRSNPQTTGEALSFLMQSTVPAATAAVDGRFSRELLEGLKGRSTAKIWDDADPDAMLVRYDTLRMYVRERMKTQRIHNKVEGDGGEADGVIARLKPAPSSKCEVRVEGAPGAVTGFVEFDGRRTGRKRTALAGQSTPLTVKPDRYSVTIDLATGYVRDNKRDVTLFDEDVLTFQFDPTRTSPPRRRGRTMSDIVVPADSSIEFHELTTGDRKTFRNDEKRALPKGRYAATVRDRDDRVVQTDFVLVSTPQTVKVADWTESAPHAAIAALLPNQNGAIDFSESLGGSVSDPDLGIWLAILGGGKILAGGGRDFSKIGSFPLHDFSGETAGASPLYVLAGFEDTETDLRIGTSTLDGQASWSAADRPAGLAGIRHLYQAREAGPQLVSFRIGETLPYTIASLASPNRATLITLTLDAEGAPLISQYLLPLGNLTANLAPFVQSRVRGRNALGDVKMLAETMRAFRNRRDVWKAFPDYVLGDILYAKWIDPIASTLAAYELVRRGRTEMLPEVVGNLSKYFPDLPDTAALARLAKLSSEPFQPVPLFLDGLRAFQENEQQLPLPASNLDFTSPWTAWRGERG